MDSDQKTQHWPLLLSGLLVLAGCTTTQSLTSQVPQTTIVLDGRTADWEGALHPVENEDFSMGVQNDGSHLYIALVTSSREFMATTILGGLTFYLDAEGGKDKSLGVRFPVGMDLEARSRGLQGAAGGLGRSVARDESLGYLELQQGLQVSRLPARSLPDLGALALFEHETLTIEIMIPLFENRDFGFTAEPGSTIGLGLVSRGPDMRRDMASLAAGGGGAARGGFVAGGGGRRGGGAGGGARAGGGGGFQQLSIQDQVRHWTTVTLAK